MIIVLVLALPSVCCRRDVQPSIADVSGPTLPPLPTFDAESVEPAVQRQIDEARQHAETDPLDAEANGRLGMLFHAYDLYATAQPCYERAAILDPSSTKWHYYLGLILVANGDPDGAVDAFDRVLARQADDVPALLERAAANVTRNQLDEALRGFDRVVTLDPDAAAAHCGAGQVLLKGGDLDRAIVRLEEAIRLEPIYGKAHYLLGQAYRKSGRLDDAARQLSLAEETSDRLPVVDDPLRAQIDQLATGAIETMLRATDLANESRFAEALPLLEESIRIRPDVAETHGRLGATLVKLDRLEEAKQSLLRALELDPNNVQARFNLGVVAHRNGEYAAAVDHFEANLRIREDHFDSHYGLATDLVEIGRPADAVGHFRRAIALRPTDARPHKALARLLADHGRGDEAIDVLRNATQRLPTDASIADRLAWLLATCPNEKLRRPDEAIAIARAVCDRTAHRVPRALDTLAVCLAAGGRFDEAVQTAQLARAVANEKGDHELKAEIDSHLILFRAGRAYQP